MYRNFIAEAFNHEYSGSDYSTFIVQSYRQNMYTPTVSLSVEKYIRTDHNIFLKEKCQNAN